MSGDATSPPNQPPSPAQPKPVREKETSPIHIRPPARLPGYLPAYTATKEKQGKQTRRKEMLDEPSPRPKELSQVRDETRRDEKMTKRKRKQKREGLFQSLNSAPCPALPSPVRSFPYQAGKARRHRKE
ncbi:hypothetical protein BT67DRAFT_443384 [Trichocladium antarcticum]|uniref:Uncharacterized protein n=1 Tax=Trichocladium antarcticum TaxID=1450529 RepID=A0AAN6ZD28_9PEZI|nr:hypothetical protein BT67DRAFT_443384 [Trichocladium antarcticum]